MTVAATAIGEDFQWRRAVLAALAECIRTMPTFTADDIWERTGRAPTDPVPVARARAMGWIMRDAGQRKVIAKTGQRVKGRYGSYVTEWKAGPSKDETRWLMSSDT